MIPHQSTTRPGRSRLPAVFAIGLAMVIGQGLAAPTAAAPAPATAQPAAFQPTAAQLAAARTPASSPLDDDHYIVMLKDKPLATYSGGVAGIPGTAVPKGKKLNPSGPNSRKYDAHLKAKQRQAAASTGVTINRSYTLALNGFSAVLSAAQAKALAGDRDVLAVVPDSMRKPDYSSTDFLGLPGGDGVWDQQFGGTDEAGKGIVVGMVDTGYTPDNPFFAGDPVDPLSGTPDVGEPYRLQGNVIAMRKANGGTFVGDCVAGDGFDGTECNSKVIGARFYDKAYKAAVPPQFRSPSEKFSPLDVSGHGSHTSSTAAGNSGVTQTAGGRDFGKSSGVAPAAKIAVYKVCWEGAIPEATGCVESDILNAIQDAVLDGVDVLNFSISGNNNSTVDAVSLASLMPRPQGSLWPLPPAIPARRPRPSTMPAPGSPAWRPRRLTTRCAEPWNCRTAASSPAQASWAARWTPSRSCWPWTSRRPPPLPRCGAVRAELAGPGQGCGQDCDLRPRRRGPR